MNTQTQEALKMAIEALEEAEDIIEGKYERGGYFYEPRKACEEALAQPAQEVGDAEIRQMLNDIEYYQKRVEELEHPAQEPVAWMRSALDNARDVCKYLDHDMIKEAKVHTKFFWNDIEKIKEPDTHPAPAQEPVAHIKQGMDGYPKLVFNGKFEYESSTAKWDDIPLYTHPAPQPAQEHIGYYYPDERMACLLFKKGLEIPRDALPLYGSPAPSWQGLSDAEILDRAAQIMVERHYKDKNK